MERPMHLSLDDLRADLITRWKGAFGRVAEVKAKVPASAETVYTEVPAYDYPLKRAEWQGIYRYGSDEVEQLEFCSRSGVPSHYERLVLAGPNVLAEQRFVCNMGGADPRLRSLSVPKKIEAILDDPHAYFIYLTLYRIEDGVTRSGLEHHENGGDVQRPTLDYEHAADGKLQRIVQHWPGGEKRTTFAAKTKTTVAELGEKLSAKIASAVLARLAGASSSSPLVALELCYRDGERLIPTLVPLTERDHVASLALSAEIDAARWIPLTEDDFAPEIAEFEQRIETQQSGAAAQKMLRAAARLVTERAPRELKLQVADGFVAFAIDWELEGDDLLKVLKACGASPEKIRAWRQRGWVR